MTRTPPLVVRSAASTVAAVAVVGAATLVGTPTTRPDVVPAAATTSSAQTVLARMTLAQRVGQLFMVGAPATGPVGTTAAQITKYHVGNVMLTGRSSAGTAATKRLTTSLKARATSSATHGVPLFVATDQEGGKVQVLSGPGFSTIPSALHQGGWWPSTVRAKAETWGRQLRAAGVNTDLAPVLDTVPSAAFAPKNAPIGYYQREFGYTTARVSTRGGAFAQGLRDAHVAATVKHFPGLGRVTANTDTHAGVTDRTTTRHDAYVGPFADAVAAGVPFVMTSSAVYSRIDPDRPAAFSRTVVTGMLRGDLGFRGVVISDDLGHAVQVASWTPGGRAISFVRAGGDMVLTVDPATLPAMYDAVYQLARTSPAFRQQVDSAALRVLETKVRVGVGLGSANG
ncbi:glycoside hydrolase family 3 protein [Angustibacter peucedani]